VSDLETISLVISAVKHRWLFYVFQTCRSSWRCSGQGAPSAIKEVITVEEYTVFINSYCPNFEVNFLGTLSLHIPNRKFFPIG